MGQDNLDRHFAPGGGLVRFIDRAETASANAFL
jgi:hypothetical protein